MGTKGSVVTRRCLETGSGETWFSLKFSWLPEWAEYVAAANLTDGYPTTPYIWKGSDQISEVENRTKGRKIS